MSRLSVRLVPVSAAALALVLSALLGAPPASAASHEVVIADSAFATPVLTVEVGDTVTWTNADDRPHTVTGQDGAFDSGNLDEGATFSFTFTEPGTYTYLCEYHPDMQATIIVEAAPAQAPQQPAPSATAQPAADAGGSTAADARGQDAGAGSQPDTAMPAPPTVPLASYLLIGLGLIGFAVGAVPLWRRVPAVTQRPRGGWRR